MKPAVLILGATGRLGLAATHAFARAGYPVLAQVRSPGRQRWPTGVTELALDLFDTQALLARAAPARVVVHAINPQYTQWHHLALPLLEQGLALARRLDALFMLPGNVYAYGEGMPPLLREDTPTAPSTDHGRIRLAMEQRLQAAAAQDGLRSVVLRAGDFYGCGRGSWLDLVIVKALAQGRLVYPGPLDLPHAWAYLPDLAQAFVAAASASSLVDASAPPACHRLHFAGHTLTGRELLAHIDTAAGVLGLRPAGGFRIGGMPWGLIRAAGLVWPMGRALARMRYLWQVPHALDGQALRQAAGPLQDTPPETALRQALIALGLAPGPQALAPV